MMIDFNKPVQTRDGRKVRVLCADGRGDHPVVGYVACQNYLYSWRLSGHRYNTDETTITDLINVPETRVVWVNMYPDESSSVSKIRVSKNEADVGAGHDREACIRVEYTVGQFDEEPDA